MKAWISGTQQIPSTERAVLLADASHNPAQLLTDDWASLTDVDPDQARATRAALARELVERAHW